jgi:dienelactone hydrolase
MTVPGAIMFRIRVLLSAVLLVVSVAAARNPIKSGYGADGSFEVAIDSIAALPVLPQVYIVKPTRSDTAWPAVFFFHGIGANDPANYRELLEHIASRGHVVIVPTYTKTVAMAKPELAYMMLRDGVDRGIVRWRRFIDSTRIGFVGHSYGGGAVPAMARELIDKKNWGIRGVYLFIMAPWYSYDITAAQLASFPGNPLLIMEVFENDIVNDHRMAKDIFDNIGIPVSRKNFIVLRSDSALSPPLYAGHNVPLGLYGRETCDRLDYYGVWRLLDALSDAALRNDSAAAAVALGNGSALQRFMGQRPDGAPVRELIGGTTAIAVNPQSSYLNFWSHAQNPRYKISSFFGESPEWNERDKTTIRNYFTISPGTDGAIDTMFSGHPAGETAFAPIAQGYGASGPYKVVKRDFPHPDFGQGRIYLISPEGLTKPAPAIVFLHGFQWAMPDYYLGLITNLASRGYHVVFPSYLLYQMTFNNNRRYDLMLHGAEEAFEVLGVSVDTTRIGFIGHSYGGAAVPAVAWHFLKVKGWGAAGSFMFIMAPWYVDKFSERQFANFPANVPLLLEVYDDDRFNDWRMAEDLFYSFKTIRPENKAFMIVHSDRRGDLRLDATHTSPLSSGSGDIDAIDYHALYRPADALASLVFDNDTAARTAALGSGAHELVGMGAWSDGTAVTPLTITRQPMTPHAQSNYVFGWGLPLNGRKSFYAPIEAPRPVWLYPWDLLKLR